MSIFRQKAAVALTFGVAAFSALSLMAGSAQAFPSETFQLNQGATAAGASIGTVTVSQNGANEVSVLVFLNPGVLFVNTGSGNSHTPFAFNTGISLTIPEITLTAPITTAACSPATFPCFAPFLSAPISGNVNLTAGFTYSGQNGGLGKGNSGPLEFTIDAPGIGAMAGGKFTDFVAGSDGGSIFAADIFNPINGATGEVTATSGTPCPDCGSGGSGGGSAPTPEPASIALIGVALTGLGIVRRRRRV